MAYFSECAAYSDWEGTISFFDSQNIYMTLKCKEHNMDLHLTLNPMQAKTLGETLVNASLYARLEKKTSLLYGDLTMDLDFNDSDKEAEAGKEFEEGRSMNEIEIDDETWHEVYNVIQRRAA